MKFKYLIIYTEDVGTHLGMNDKQDILENYASCEYYVVVDTENNCIITNFPEEGYKEYPIEERIRNQIA